jgi:hypothetical protein
MLPMHWFENLPWWATVPLIIGGALMSAFSNSFPQGFQTAGLLLGIIIALFGCVAVAWHFMRIEGFVLQWPIQRKQASSPTLAAGLYVSDIRFTFADLEKDRHSEISMRVFNGTGNVVEFSSIAGHIKFSASISADQSRMGDLPTPSPRPDMVRLAAPFQEWLLILNQRVPAAEADKLLAMLEADIPIHFDLNRLMIAVCAQDDRQIVVRLPIWVGVSYSRDRGFGQIINASMRITG